MIGDVILQPKELLMMPEIPWLKRFDEKPQEEPDTMEQIDYVTMLEKNEYR